jgi:hypothetical protein
MFIRSKAIFILAVCFWFVLVGCRHHAASKTISASSDATGSHPASADIAGPVAVTCVSATDDGGDQTPAACVISAPGANGVVKIGDKVALATAGSVILTCQGKGTLACTARIE